MFKLSGAALDAMLFWCFMLGPKQCFLTFYVYNVSCSFAVKRHCCYIQKPIEVQDIVNYSEIFLKSTVKRATKKCNLFCKTGAKREEQQCCTFYHQRKNLATLFVYKTGSNIVSKTRNILIPLVLQQCFKTSCRVFCYPFYCSINSVLINS